MKTHWISLSLVAFMAMAASLMADDQFTIEEATNEAKRLRPKLFHFGQPFTHFETIGADAARLRERLIELSMASILPQKQQTPWRAVVGNSVVLSSISEWNSLELAKAGIEKWFEVIDQQTEIDESERAELALGIANTHAANWIKVEPVYAAEFLQAVEARYLPSASRGAIRSWHFRKSSFSRDLLRAADAIKDAEQAASLRQLAMASLKYYWLDESIALSNRTFSLVAYARGLFSRGQNSDAEALLDSWWRQHGDQIDSGEFYSAWFFTALNGRGDVDKARMILGQASELVASDRLAHNPGDFRTMVRAYYRSILLSEIDLAVEAERSQAEKLAASSRKEP